MREQEDDFEDVEDFTGISENVAAGTNRGAAFR